MASVASKVCALGQKQSAFVWSCGFLAEARNILRLSRTECSALGLVFPILDEVRQTLVFDLLAGAGTPHAQEVMQRLFRKCEPPRDELVQRLGYVERPTASTIDALVAIYESATTRRGSRSAAYSLGAAAGRAALHEDSVDAAARAAEVLRRDLARATTTSDKCALVTALGNTGLETETILALVDDRDERVRATATLALRKHPAAKSRLLDFVASAPRAVAENALSALAEHVLDADEVRRLALMVLEARTPIAFDGRILRLILTNPWSDALVEDAERVLLSRIDFESAKVASERVSYTPPPRSGLVPRSIVKAESRVWTMSRPIMAKIVLR